MTQDKPTKTAMMELIDAMDDLSLDGRKIPFILYQKATELLEKEKTQIVDAYDYGYDDFKNRGDSARSGEEYFTQTYKQ